MVGEERQRKSSKKNKTEKIPQRGLGVAQLEKIRCMEEQQRIAGASSSDFSTQGLGFPPPPLTTAAVMKPRAASTFFTDYHHHHHHHQRQQPPPPPGFIPMVWNAAVDAKEASLVRKIGVPLHRMKQPPPPPPPIASLQANSPTCHRMEPPSNQNNSNNYDLLSCWRSEQNKNSVEMMVCNKRPPPAAAFHPDEVVVAGNQEAYCPRKHPFLSNECSRATGSNLVRLQFQASRGNTSTPIVNSTSSDLYIDKGIKENCGVHDGNFLSLASVSAPSLTQYDHCDFSLKNAQKNTVNVSSSNELPFYDFLLIAPIRDEETTMLEIKESPTGDIDLNLRL
ncbi:uncharacterized protein LOC122003650 [Zingiber officinale]|uniref:uncharacterized protein LOC122003650 n=1 Tax=Zingiber officinale TaxID=94328 RepID=UPI001C4C2B39|nr:uncharacterized protein LOC122003650 [Zingiber officinale]